MNTHKTYFNWSSGKDSALALYYLLQDKRYLVEELVTSINTQHNRVTMHGLRKDLLIAQLDAMSINYSFVEFSESPNMKIYEQKMMEAVTRLKKKGFTHSAFGDIFLEDLRLYREQQLAKLNIKPLFPIWKKDTKTLINEFLDLGFKTMVVCANSKYVNKDFVGTIIDKNFIKNLPKQLDPCGENGEFHTFCFDGPIFKNPIKFTIGEKIYREYDAPKVTNLNSKTKKYGFWYGDLLPIQ